jgi:hypothetical protein
MSLFIFLTTYDLSLFSKEFYTLSYDIWKANTMTLHK